MSRVAKRGAHVCDVRQCAETIEQSEVDEPSERQRQPLDPLLLNHRLPVPVENIRAIRYVLPVEYQQ